MNTFSSFNRAILPYDYEKSEWGIGEFPLTTSKLRRAGFVVFAFVFVPFAWVFASGVVLSATVLSATVLSVDAGVDGVVAGYSVLVGCSVKVSLKYSSIFLAQTCFVLHLSTGYP